MKIEAAFLVAVMTIALAGCGAKAPSSAESGVATELKRVTIGGKDDKNPIPFSDTAVKNGAEHFQHHCQICHGLDGQNSGVPFAEKMSPPVADLKSKRVQDYSDGQLRWIMQNGIRFTGMPGWKGVLDDEEMWNIVHYLRHLPEKGSLGEPEVFKESGEQHEHAQGAEAGAHTHSHDEDEHGAAQQGTGTPQKKPHTHAPGTPPHKD